jgi:hypothetical protein
MSIEKLKADYHDFIDIQTGKYLRLAGKDAFDSDKEANKIMGEIIQTWNQKVVPFYDNIEEKSREVKAAYFNSIEIEFTIVPPEKDNYDEVDDALADLFRYYDDVFYFLPPGAFMFILFSGPALAAYGYPLKRLKEILRGEPPTNFEKDLFHWAYDLTEEVFAYHHETNKEQKKEHYLEAVLIAEEMLDEELIDEVIEDIISYINEDWIDNLDEWGDIADI